jgi:hypothetical protein
MLGYLQKWKSGQRNRRAAGSFKQTSYTPEDGQLGRNMQKGKAIPVAGREGP